MKVGQYHRNGKRERKSHQPSGVEEDSEVEEAGNPGYNDISFYQNIPEDEFDNIPYHSTAGTPEAQREDSELRSTGQQQMSPHTGPATPLFHGEGAMGDTPSKLAKAGLYQPVEQQRKSDQPVCNRLGDNFTVDELDSPRVSIRSSSAYEPSQSPPGYIGRDDQPLSHIPQSTKRALSDQARGRKSKKNKISSNVHTVKPTLLVVLKLTRGKNATDRATTMAPRVPSTEVNENPVGHAATRRRCSDDVATDYETRDEQHHIQPTMPNQDPANNDSEAATDITCGSNDRTTACRASGSTIHMDDHTRPSIFTQQQPLTTQQEQDSERLAELLERCSRGEVYGILKQLMVRSLKEQTPEEVESNILLPVLRQILDQVLSTTSGIDPHSMASDVQERFTSQNVCLCQHHCMPVDNSIDHLRRTSGDHSGWTAVNDCSMDVDVLPRRRIDVEHTPLISGVDNTNQEAAQIPGPARIPVDAAQVLQDVVGKASATSRDLVSVQKLIIKSASKSRSFLVQLPAHKAMLIKAANSSPEVDDSAGQKATIHQIENDAASSAILSMHQKPSEETTRETTPTHHPANTIDRPGLENSLNTHGTAISSANNHDHTPTDIPVRLYLDEETNSLKPQGYLTLDGLLSKDQLFTEIQAGLEEYLDVADQIASVTVKRADGEVFDDLYADELRITRAGKQDVWKLVIRTILKHGAGEGGLKGYVKMKKLVDDK